MDRHPSYWEGSNPSFATPPKLPARVDVLIVGGGMMGRWLAWWLSRQRPAPSILVLERDALGYGASSRNAGFLTAGNISEMLADAQAAGFEAVLDTCRRRRDGAALLRAALPGLPLDECGSTDFDPVTDAGRELAARLNAALGEPAWVERTARLAGHPAPAFFAAADAGLNPVALMRRLEAESTPVAAGVEVTTLGGGEAAGPGFSLRYRRAFLCTNAFAAQLEPASPIVPGRGQVIVTSPVSARTDHTLGYLRGGYDYFRFVDGRLLIGGGRDLNLDAESTDAIATTDAVLAHLRQAAKRVIGHDNWRVEWHWAGIMGFVRGRHLGGPIRRRIDDRTEAVAGFGGMGVALSPAVARDIAATLEL